MNSEGDMNRLYHFDALPAHPQPQPFETLTSHITRLAESNAMSSVAGLSAVLFPYQDRKYVANLADYPPISLNAYSVAAMCSESRLLDMTFYPLARRLGRAARPQAVSNFMGGAVAPYLRYCPHCLMSQPYYRLQWRFLSIEACVEHGCRFLDQCGHCGQPVPLCAPPFKLGVCPKCRGTLVDCTALPVDPDELTSLQSKYMNLSFLLSPLTASDADLDTLLPFVGRRFSRARQTLGETQETVAKELKVSRNGIEAVERGAVRKGVKLHVFLSYAEHLNSSMRTIFEDAKREMTETWPQQEEDSRPVASLDSIREELLLNKVEEAISLLAIRNMTISLRTVARIVMVSDRTLKKYARIASLVDQFASPTEKLVAAKLKLCEDELLVIVQDTIEFLQTATSGQRVTKGAIHDLSGLSMKALEGHPRIKQLIEVATSHDTRFRARETYLVAKVEREIAHMTELDEPFTPTLLSESIGVDLSTLRRYPQVAELLAPYLDQEARRRQQIDILKTKVLEVRQALEDAGRPTTAKEIGKLVGLSPTGLVANADIHALITESAEAHRSERIKYLEDLVARIPEAVQQLQKESKRVSKRSIAALLGCKEMTLRYAPGALQLLQAIGVTATGRRQHTSKEDELEAAVIDAVNALRMNSKPVSTTMVSEVVGVPRSTLRRYPRVLRILSELDRDEQRDREKCMVELVQQLQEVGENLTDKGVILTKHLLAEAVGIPPSRLQRQPLKAVTDKLIHLNKEVTRSNRERDLLACVLSTQATLEACGERVSVPRILKLNRLTSCGMRRYPSVAEALLNVQKKASIVRQCRKEKREAQLVEAVQKLIAQLEESGQLVTVRTIAEAVGMSSQSLMNYPLVAALLRQVRDENRRRKDAQLMAEVEKAIEALQASNSVLSVSAIARMLGCAVNTLMSRPEVHARLQPVATASSSERRDEAYLLCVLRAIEMLRGNEEQVTAGLVAKTVGIRLSTLRYHPRTRAVLLELSKGHQRKRKEPAMRRVQVNREEHYVCAVLEAVETLRTRGDEVTSTAITRVIGVRVGTLRKYPRVKAMLHQLDTHLHSQQEEAYMASIISAYERLLSSGVRITQTAIMALLGVKDWRLRQFPRAFQVLKDLIEGNRLEKEDQLVSAVLHTIELILQRGELPTQRAIAELCGGTYPGWLKRYSRVRIILQDLREVNLQKKGAIREAELISQVLNACAMLEQQGKRKTHVAIAELAGVWVSTLHQYPGVVAILDRIKMERKAERERYESELVAKVHAAHETLLAQKKFPTMVAVSNIVGVSTDVLSGYPRVNALFQHWNESRSRRQEREAELFSAVQRAIAELREQGRATTQVAIGRLLGMSPFGLKRYPRIRQLLEECSAAKTGHPIAKTT